MEAFITFVWFTSAGFSAFIAYEKNRNVLGWALMGLFFGVFAFFTVLILPKLDKPTMVTNIQVIEDAEIVADPAMSLAELDARIAKAKTRFGM